MAEKWSFVLGKGEVYYVRGLYRVLRLLKISIKSNLTYKTNLESIRIWLVSFLWQFLTLFIAEGYKSICVKL
jgi:hypothetical protein